MSSFPQIGFLAAERPRKHAKPKKLHSGVAATDSINIPDSDCLLRFDSGRALTFAQGARSSLVIGGTGSGKTRSVLLPAARNLLRAGYGGYIPDYKGNLRTQIRAIAADCGRLDDIVEFGTSATACPTNLLAGMQDHEIADLLNTMAITGVQSDYNVSWHQKGVKLGCDVLHALSDISSICRRTEFAKKFTPTLLKLYVCMTNHTLARGLWAYYTHLLETSVEKRRNCRGAMPDYLRRAQSFFHQVSAEHFHVMTDPKKFKNLGSSGTTQYMQQLSWMTERLVRMLRLMHTTHGMLRQFSCDDDRSVPMDFDKLVYGQRKIVLVHFPLDSAEAGAIIARIAKERFYQAVLRNGLDASGYTFMLGDEFQDICDLDPTSRMNDMQFFSVSREFRNINLIASQSIASLRANKSANAVTSLIGNCMTKIILQCGDPETMQWVSSYRPAGYGIKLLRRGACYLECFTQDGNSLSTMDMVNDAYQGVEAVLRNTPHDHAEALQDGSCDTGQSGPPYLVETLLMRMADSPELADDAAEWLDRMREASKKGLPCWDESGWEECERKKSFRRRRDKENEKCRREERRRSWANRDRREN